MRNALYARQSVDKKDSISIETQLEKARLECDPADGIEQYVDRGYSGKNTNRPDFMRLMQDVQKGLIDRVVVYKLDRFSRSILDFSRAWEILSKQHVEFVSVNERFDTSTPIGKAMLYITIVFAQMERETIAERITDNYYSRITYGSWPGGPAPYGFEVGRLKSAEGKYIPTLVETTKMEVIDLIFTRYAQEDISLGKLARYLTLELQEAGPRRASWNNVTLARILRNPVYVQADVDVYAYFQELGVTIANDLLDFTGEYAGMLVGKRGAGTRQRKEIKDATFAIGNWKGRITSRIWLKCQYRLESNVQIKNTGKGKYTWLSGLIRCGYCGRTFRIIVDQKYPDKRLLYCSGRADYVCTHLTKWQLSDVEAIVEKELTAVLETMENRPAEEEQISNTVKMQLKEIEEKMDNLAGNLSNTKASDNLIELINAELEKLQKQKNKLLEEIAAQTQRKMITYEKIDFDRLEFAEKKIVAQNYINAVILKEDSCQIQWKV